MFAWFPGWLLSSLQSTLDPSPLGNRSLRWCGVTGEGASRGDERNWVSEHLKWCRVVKQGGAGTRRAWLVFGSSVGFPL